MSKRRKHKVPNLSADEAAQGNAGELQEESGESDEELMRKAFADLSGNLVRQKGIESTSEALRASPGDARGALAGRASISVDLHGLTLSEACEVLDNRISYHFGTGFSSVEALVITGKGIHSGPGGGVLAKEVHRHVVTRYRHSILSIETSPGETLINGIPFRGHFRVVIKRPV
jgi:DNA-nicking Smr family endonuclease